MDNSFCYTNDWFSRNIPIWESFLSRIPSHDLRLLEIGSFEGRSAVWLISNVLKGAGEIVCIDTWSRMHENDNLDWEAIERRFDHNTARAQQIKNGSKLTKLKGASHRHLRELNTQCQGGFDFIYIDGSHCSADVMEDLVLSFRLCRVGGIIACDDYLFEFGKNPLFTPKLAIDAFITCYATKVRLLEAPLYQVYLQKLGD